MIGRVGAVRRYLGSRRNIAGTVGAVAGVGLHLAGLVAEAWPVVAAGLYALGVLLAPRPRPAAPGVDPGLVDALRAEVEAQLTRVELRRAELPPDAERAVRRVVRTLRVVLDRLDGVFDDMADRIAAPEWLADAAGIVRTELAACLDVWFERSPSTAEEPAARELGTQLALIGDRADRLAARIPDVHARRAEELTRELRRRHQR